MAAACGSEDAEVRTVTVVPPADLSVCSSPTFRFQIGYPAGWHTSHPSRDIACLFFEPQPFDVPENSDFTGTALEVQPAQETFANVVRSLRDERFQRVVLDEETTVVGQPAVRVETEATGEGLLPEGTRVYAYVVDRDGQAFIVQTTEAEGADFDARKRVLDRVVRTLRFTGPPPRLP